MKRFRIQLVMAFIVFVCGVSLMGVIYIVFNKPEVYVNPGIVVSSPSPVAVPMNPMYSYSLFRSRQVHPVYSIQTPRHQYPSATMPAYKGLYTTSSARVQSVGGGSNPYAIATTSQGSSSRGISYSGGIQTTMPAATFVALASQRQVAEPAAADAPQMARLVSGPRRAPGPPSGPVQPGYDGHQLVEQPAGDAVWPLVAMLLAYALARVYKRNKEKA